jgi:hypothetical protein
VKTNDVIIIRKYRGEFYTSMKIMAKQDNFKWEIVNVYGPVQLERKATFLAELGKKVADMEDPFVLGGDFNLIRFAWENRLTTFIQAGWGLLMSSSETTA